MKIYLSGPILGKDYREVCELFESTKKAMDAGLAKFGHESVNPLEEIPESLAGDEKKSMKIRLKKMLECEAIQSIVDPPWLEPDSKLEWDLARYLGYIARETNVIYYNPDHKDTWTDEWGPAKPVMSYSTPYTGLEAL